MNIYKATSHHLPELTLLFNGYRVFYKQSPNLEAAHVFITERLLKNDSVIFIAMDSNSKGLGFTQLYPSFSSVSLQRTYILNDLYVISEGRNKGVGEALLKRAKEFAINENSKGLTLETDINNPAQKLYERLDWKKDTLVNHYTWEI